MTCSVLHHVEVCVKDDRILQLLTGGFGFTPFAYRVTQTATKLALRSGTSVFVVVKRNSKENYLHIQNDLKLVQDDLHNGFANSNGYRMHNGEHFAEEDDTCGMQRTDAFSKISSCTEGEYKCPIMHEEKEHWTVFCCEEKSSHVIDSVFNVALVVKDVHTITQRVKSQGGRILKEPTELADSEGRVRYSIVTSCCGNIVHTLIDKKDYSGSFLPGFETINSHEEKFSSLEVVMKLFREYRSISTQDMSSAINAPSLNTQTLDIMKANSREHFDSVIPPISTFIDHVTYVCEVGKSSGILSWYENCFGMKRFKTNRDDSEYEGFVLGGNIGLRLKVMEYWRCAETFLSSPDVAPNDMSLKLVIAESLPGVSTSHVNTFLRAHNGPGIQHIGLHTPTMVATVDFMAKNGVVFRKAPPVYYEEGIKLDEIKEAGHGEEVELFKELGILLDTEADSFINDDRKEDKKSYLMQVFTGPLFDEDTFFLEVIQRKGATGFGAGNITALAKSIIIHNQMLKEAK